jgi:AraC-like DNA-binding protein
LTEPFSLDHISEHFFISKHHLNKLFRLATGTTIYDYLLYKRVIYAQQLLIDGLNASEAALEAGFKDYSSFYRAYTKFLGHSPAKDREASFLLPEYR